ncbi:hypothetical protein BDV95DRAFT_608873 [Massariosphaeria phaeospora]|uniref:TAP-C domain-containing protein n=1 Tax=Massariosphaeria phaeospora TaxID=100035 RepID=A0A7C8I6E1_9PLEO|nr:hypothetical protein BDV95DRAFT_608873 [Massariosphaeria phaeospora]
MPSAATRRPTGIRKIQKQQQRDRDGDLIMGAAPRATTRPNPRNKSDARTSSARTDSPATTFSDVKVTGWSDEKEIPKLLGFLERHAARRNPHAAAKGRYPQKMIRHHQILDNALVLSVRSEEVIAFSKLNGFSFASAHGRQKLTLTGPGLRARSPAKTPASDPPSSKTENPTEASVPASASVSDIEREQSKASTITLLKAFLTRHYNGELKLLDLSNIIADEEIAQSGMFDSPATQTKFFPALMVVCDEALPTAEVKRETVHSVLLSNNGLANVDVIQHLSKTFPDIKNLDLSGNNFEGRKDVKKFKLRFSSLEHLIIGFSKEEAGWEEDVVSWFPKLKFLNQQPVRVEEEMDLML